MSFRDDHIGGLIPLITAGRDVYVSPSTETDYHVELIWLRRSLTIKFGTLGLPRQVRRQVARAREHDARRAGGALRQAMADITVDTSDLEPKLRIGDRIDSYLSGIPDYVLTVASSDSTVWRRATGDERYPVEDGGGQIDRSQKYEWISWDRGHYTGGQSTTDGLLDYVPLTVLEVAGSAA